jgi:hypothetical protein
MVKVLVTRTTRKTGAVITSEFSTERGAFEHVRAMLYDNTKIPLRLCEDTAEMICNPKNLVQQTRWGPFLWTINRMA